MGEVQYPATAFEQCVLRAVKELAGDGDEQTIVDKVHKWGETGATMGNVSWTLCFLESIGYLSSSLSEQPKGESGESRKTYEIGIFGERALASEPFRRLEAAGIERRKALAFLAFGVNNLNYFFLGITWLNRPLLFAFCLATAWLLAGAYEMWRLSRLYANLPWLRQ
jgi:hypothetical protein